LESHRYTEAIAFGLQRLLEALLRESINVKELISQLKQQWGGPRAAMHRGEVIPFELACKFGDGASNDELSGLSNLAPKELLDFWKEAREADLFVDSKYGQWGLRLWSPARSVGRTQELRSASSTRLVNGDLIIGEFLGDSDLLLVRCDPGAQDFGRILIVLPLDRRADWPTAAANFADFLKTYANESGDKFWDHVHALAH
jgi:hypothetical protein